MSKYLINYNKLAINFLRTIDTKDELANGIVNLELKIVIEVFKILINREYFEYVDVVIEFLNSKGVNFKNYKLAKQYSRYINYLGEVDKAYKFWDSVDMDKKIELLELMKSNNLFNKDISNIEEHELIAMWKYIN